MTHRQTTALLSHGLTGLSSWPASIFLGDYLSQNPELFSNSIRIIELGAGSGLLGLSLLKYFPSIERYRFTDYSAMILNLLKQNISVNYSEEEQKRIEVEELDWNEPMINESESKWNLILATGLILFIYHEKYL